MRKQTDLAKAQRPASPNTVGQGLNSRFQGTDHGDFCRRSQSGAATDRLTVAHHHPLNLKTQDFLVRVRIHTQKCRKDTVEI